MGSRGTYYLETDTFEGENPIASFGKNAAHHLKRTDSFKYVPDILVNSFYNPETREVAAFEELIGSHGGMNIKIFKKGKEKVWFFNKEYPLF